jgi:uncharacterized repeat protein (TIGR03943 family)
VNARTQGYVLLLFGGALIRLGVSDLLLRYVRPVARPWVLLAGVGLVVLAIAQLVLAHRTRAERTPATGTGWLLLAPVIAIVVIAPPALGSFSASRAPVGINDQTRKDFPALAGPTPHTLKMLEFTTRVLWDAGRTVAGQDVQLTGFVLKQRPGGFVLARLVITCCAADARPVEVFVRSVRHPAADQWVTVIGRYSGNDRDQPSFPLLTARSVESVTQPKNPYD